MKARSSLQNTQSVLQAKAAEGQLRRPGSQLFIWILSILISILKLVEKTGSLETTHKASKSETQYYIIISLKCTFESSVSKKMEKAEKATTQKSSYGMTKIGYW